MSDELKSVDGQAWCTRCGFKHPVEDMTMVIAYCWYCPDCFAYCWYCPDCLRKLEKEKDESEASDE